jgi:D-serine dehydratase
VDKRVAALRQRPAAPTDKGFGLIGPVTAEQLATRKPAALGPEFTMPLLVLKDSALTHNAAAMADWCARSGVLLAPHGKTTMAPQLFARQLDAGAWGMTAATIGQVQVYRAFGVQRIVLANELTDRAGIAWLAGELSADPGFDCYVYADSPGGVRLLDEGLRAAGASRPLPVLVELGYPGGRSGCRDIGQALEVASAVRAASTLQLAGAAGFEGGLISPDAVTAWCRQLSDLAGRLPGEPVVSAGGSVWFDIVAAELAGPGRTVVLRSGCYLTHDHGHYADAGPGSRHAGPAFIPAMELWAAVLSRPERTLALAGAGRRDVSFDHGLPVVLRPAPGLAVTRLDDQHAYLSVPADAELAPGDLVCLGISHPCTTFDKWRAIPVVDDAYRVIDVVHTFF